MCEQLRRCLCTRGNRTGTYPVNRHYTERAALYVPIFPLHRLQCLKMPADEAKQFERLSANEKKLYNVVTVMNNFGVVEHYRLNLGGCFVLDRRYLLPVAGDARFFCEYPKQRNITYWVKQHKLRCDILSLHGFYPRRASITNKSISKVFTSLDHNSILIRLCEYGCLFP